MFVKKELTFDDMADFLWGLARENWLDATDNERRDIWYALEDIFSGDVPEAVTVNDAVAFDFDTLLGKEDDEENESFNRRRKLESRIKRLEKMLMRNK